jgi:NAD(P)H-nitrite reductase large subunit
LQKNSFEVLNHDYDLANIRADMEEADLRLENEVNSALENSQGQKIDSDSQEDFVEDTQQEGHSKEDEIDTSSKEDVADCSKVMEERNQAFLAQSWANMAEDDEAEQRLLKGLEKEALQDDSEFQVIGRPKGKVTKPKHPVRSYTTRKSTGNPKPFK